MPDHPLTGPLEEELRRARTMDAVSRLAAGIAHEINNLLTSVGMYSELALADLHAHDHQKLQSEISGIKDVVARAGTLTRQLLAVGRAQVMADDPLDVDHALHELEPHLRRLVSEEITLSTVLRTNGTLARADRAQLEQVVLALVVNAREAMPRGGKLTIETSLKTLNEIAAAPDAEPGEYVLLTVSDTGVGMEPEEREHAFEPFYTTKMSSRGAGLGLSIAHGIVCQAGGWVHLDSTPGLGTEITVAFPAVTQAAPSPPAAPRQPAAAAGGETVLLVEDDAVVRGLVRETLESQGYVVLEAEGPEEALRLAGRHDGTIDLMLSDVFLPGMSGFQLAERIVPAYRDLRLLFTSGYANEGSVSLGGLGAQVAFIEKPFSVAELARTVRAVLDRP